MCSLVDGSKVFICFVLFFSVGGRRMEKIKMEKIKYIKIRSCKNVPQPEKSGSQTN